MTDPTALKNQRGRIKGLVTKMATFADSISTETGIEDITARLEKLEEYWHLFIKTDDDLVLLEVPSDLDEFEDKYSIANAKLLRALNQRKAAEPSAGPSTSTSEQLNSTMMRLLEHQRTAFDTFAHNASINPLDLKLPKINIPIFTGDYKDWPSFKDLFMSSVHLKTSLSNIHKFHYLKSALKDEAASVIKHFTITDGNYVEAWTKLVSRYDKKKQILTSYIKVFVNQPTLAQPSLLSVRNLTNTSDELIRGIKSLGSDASGRDPWLIYLLLNKCDTETRLAWAEDTADVDIPSFTQLISFLNKRCDALESLDLSTRKPPARALRTFHAKTLPQCPKCSQPHNLFHCPEFKTMDTQSRRTFVIQNALCFNCLNSGHTARKCKSRFKFHFCNKSHHSTLHIKDLAHSNHITNTDTQSTKTNSQSSASHASTNASSITQGHSLNTIANSKLTTLTATSQTSIQLSLLPTALVHIIDSSGSLQPCNMLIDTGSTASFISEDCIQRLGLKRDHHKQRVSGFGLSTPGFIKGSVNVTLCSRHDSTSQISIKGLILSRLTSTLPSTAFNITDWNFLKHYDLADPHLNIPKRIDLLLGADHAFYILRHGLHIVSPEAPVIQNTIFGYILSGNLITFSAPSELQSFHADVDVDKTLRMFWEVEDLPHPHQALSEEEELCERVFTSTCQVDEHTGRYVVRLPFKQTTEPLENTRIIATASLHSLERRFKANAQLHADYTNFLEEYKALNHLESIPQELIQSVEEHAYLPHHAVIKPSSSTTKLRVVFNGSAKSSTDLTLNQKLCVGPTVQRDLYSILLSFRTFKVAVTADIEKMYRQVLVAAPDRTYQRILWRDSPDKPIEHFWLTTVTYGTASAPFLATRALKQLTVEFKGDFPLAEQALQQSFYVDDLMSGANGELAALDLYTQLTILLQKRGFLLRKWASNSGKLLRMIPETQAALPLKIDEHADTIKVLGLNWNPTEDSFFFHVNLPIETTATKRKILSNLSRLFDPLGLLAPITITAKILFQQICLKNYDWDDVIQGEIAQKWNFIIADLSHLPQLRIPGWIHTKHSDYELHGFCDASESAYATTVDCRTMTQEGKVAIHLLTAKTKVAPIKQISLRRSELCGALLLSKLITSVRAALQHTDTKCYAWTDSTVVLTWLSSHPSKWKCFIGTGPQKSSQHSQDKHCTTSFQRIIPLI